MILRANTLKKEERLSGFKALAGLFDKGSSRLNYPIKIIFLKKDDDPDGLNRAVFSVSKKYHKKATDRNLLKRRMREAYRLNKKILSKNSSVKCYDLAFIYIAGEILPYGIIEKSVTEILSRLAKK